MNSDNIWTKRLKWVEARKGSKNKYERISLGLKIARYDYEVARRYGNKVGKQKARTKITALNRRLKEMTINDELKAVKTKYNNSKKQIEYDKKLGYTFSEEVRNNTKYLYKQKRVDSKKEHEYVAKNWKDLDTKQYLQAQEQVGKTIGR